MAEKKPIDKTRLLLSSEGRAFFPRQGELHTKEGHIPASQLKKAKLGTPLKTNLGKEYFLIKPGFLDLYRKIKRGAQIIPLKDIGSIVTHTSIGSSSRVVDAGAGSGALACLLASIAKEVVTYELRDDFIEIVKSNIEWLGLKNITLKKGDIRENIKERNRDLLTLDIPDPWNALTTAASCLKVGGYLVSYSPTIPQVMDFVKAVTSHKAFLYLRTTELLEREWEIDERRVRPFTQGIGHSGFLSFARKIQEIQ